MVLKSKLSKFARRLSAALDAPVMRMIRICASLVCVSWLLFALVPSMWVQTVVRVVNADSGIRFDEYGHLSFKEEAKRLDNLAGVLRRDAKLGSKGYVYVFAGKGQKANEVWSRACRAKQYLVKVNGIESKRVIAAAIMEGSDVFKVELWIYPREAPDVLYTRGSAQYITEDDAKTCRKSGARP